MAEELENASPAEQYLIFVTPPTLDHSIGIEWEEYDEIEGMLLEMLNDGRRPLSERLILMDTATRVLSAFLVKAQSDPLKIRDRTQSDIVRYFRRRMRDETNPVYHNAQRIPAVRVMRKRVAKVFRLLREQDEKTRPWWHRFLGGRRRLEISSIVDTLPVDEILTAYLSHCIWRKDLLTAPRLTVTGTIQQKLCELIIAAALVADILRRGGRERAISEEETLDAVRTVERNIVLHTSGAFTAYDVRNLRALMEDEMEHKTFIASVLGS
jgi:hypothetical protein